jgi:hypothetical protein
MNTKGYARQSIVIGSNGSQGGGGASVLGVKTIADAHRMRGLHP